MLSRNVHKFGRQIHILIRNLYDKFTAKVVDIPLACLFSYSDFPDEIQFVVAARVLDIKNFIEGKTDFYYQNLISNIQWGDKHDRQLGNSRFAALIRSVQEQGYDNDKSIVTTDDKFRLIDGTHRVAMAYMAGISTVRAKVVRWKSHHNTNLDLFLHSTFSEDDTRNVLDAWKEIKEKTSISYKLTVNKTTPEQAQAALDLQAELKLLEKVVDVENSEGQMTISFLLRNPEFCIEGGVVISNRIIRLRGLLNKRYPALDMTISPVNE